MSLTPKLSKRGRFAKVSKIKPRSLWKLLLMFAAVLYLSSGIILPSIGEFLVVDETPVKSDAVVVLNTGLEFYPRLIQAADLYRQGMAGKVVVNGNRKSDALRELETKGFKRCCPWYEDTVRILELLGVLRKDVITISVEDAYDTVSEAKAVGKSLVESGISSIIISTSKSHSRRADYIWEKIFSNQLEIRTVAAQEDPYSPSNWWKDGRQIKWVMSEYGAWVYYFFMKSQDSFNQ